MENKVKVWIARDECGYAFIHLDKPSKTDNIVDIGEWISNRGGGILQEFPQIKWEDDEPTEAYITLTEPQEQPKKVIDWEQRKYDMIKDMLVQKWLADKVKNDRLFPYKDNDDIASAINYADRVINELKKQSE